MVASLQCPLPFHLAENILAVFDECANVRDVVVVDQFPIRTLFQTLAANASSSTI